MNTGNADEAASSQSRSRWRHVLTALLGAMFVVCFVLFTLGIVVQRDLLDPELYIQALDDNDVYGRLYTEVLADPEMQDRFKDQISINLDIVAEELYAQVVAAGALVVPPSTLQGATESVIRDVVAYLRGDVPEVDATVENSRALDREALSRRIIAGLAAASSSQVADASNAEKDPDALDQDALAEYVGDLEAGIVRPAPEFVWTASVGGITREERASLTDTLLGGAATTTDEATRLQIEASLASDDLPSAVTTASMAVLKPRIESAVDALLGRIAQSGAVDGLAAAAAAISETRASIINSLNTVRGYAELLQRAMIPLALIMLVLVGAIVWLNGDDLRSALASAGWVLVVSSGAALALWFVSRWWLRSALASRLESATGMPPGLESVLDDVVGSLAREVFGSIWGVTLFWLLIGCIALALAYSERLGERLRRVLEPVWAHRRAALAGLVALLVIVPLIIRVTTTSARAANPPCNGHPELCDRRINEVSYPTTHNAMSITQYGWLWPMHDGTVTDQLEAGVRALMIDTLYVDDIESERRFFETLSPEQRRVAEERISRMPTGPIPGALLCHGSCKLGATLLDDTLEEILSFLEENPREVVFVIIQDEITAEDTEVAFTNTGLVSKTFTPKPGQTLPTLGELIEADTRLIVMAENESPPPDWYPNAWDLTEETPYTFVFKEDFSCDPNRGGTGKPFFLLNHWIQRAAPNRVDAAIVNDYDFLLSRAQQCAEERGKTPNFIAVNFYRQGDLLRVVDTLNGVATEVPKP